MLYGPKVLEYFEHPVNVGELDENDPDVGTATVGSPECGDVMRLQVKINEDGIIEDAKFKTFGCASAIASSCLATEWIKGRHYTEALEVKNIAIAKELELPPIKVHCSVLAEDSIKGAVEDWIAKHGDKEEEKEKEE
jgi:nitrogen fixation NifU-like protein